MRNYRIFQKFEKFFIYILFHSFFYSLLKETSRLVEEPTALVRKQTLLTIDSILESYPNCYPVIWIWCKVITPMLHDADTKNIEVAMEVCLLNKSYKFI